MKVLRQPFGAMPDGTPVERFTLENGKGLEVEAISYGGIITSVRTPDGEGRSADVVLGFDTLAPYLRRHPYFGAIVGRYGNRIGGAAFTIDGRRCALAANNGGNHLHGGTNGFDRFVWQAEPVVDDEGVGVSFSRTSPDGEEGYPGTLQARVTYTLSRANELTVDYRATADRATPVNLTQHSYFNLAGHDAGDILAHELTLFADAFVAVDGSLIPTGALVPVDGTPFDFRQATALGARIAEAHPQLTAAGGYDHNLVLAAGQGLRPAARLVDPRSGRSLEVSTTEPGMQLYTGNFLNGSQTGKGGASYHHRNGVCLETQHYPDSPNQPAFPTTILRPGQTYRSRTVYTFGIS